MAIETQLGEADTRRKRNAAFDRDLTKGSIIGNLWTLTWPSVVSSTIMMLGPTIDMIWVGSLGSASIAGVGVAGMAAMVLGSARMGLSTGTRALLARAIGAGDEQQANHVAQQAFVISTVFSILMAAIGIFLAEPILALLGVEPDVVREGSAYMRIMFAGSVTMSFGMMAQGIMQASGDAITPMKVGIGVRIFHVILCPFLIFGWWIFPYMGVSGAAATNVISHGIGGIIMLWILFSGHTRLRLTMRNFRFDGAMIWRIVKIGVPSSITGMERSLANLVLMVLVVPFGTAAVAAHSLVERIDMFVNMPAFGLGQAAGVLAGQNLGAGHPDRAEKTAWTAAGLFTCMTVLASVAIWFWAEYTVRVFNSEPEIVATTAAFLRINIISYLVFGVVVVLMNALTGVGDTMTPMLTTLITMWLVQVPMAFVLPKVTTLGVYGVRWAIVTAIVMRAIIYTVYFRKGRWKLKEV
ncbi:MAG: MATE family efflux transporter [Desulfobacterales bacterium]